MIENLGYACINMTLSNRGITTNRGMIKRTFQSKGINYASELALKNAKDLYSIIEWNYKNDISLFRVSSDIFPWSSEYKLSNLPNYGKISDWLASAGFMAQMINQRITSHPGPFNVLCSPNERVVKNTIKELTTHGEVFDLMGLPSSHKSTINIHCNGVYGDKQKAMDRFCLNFEKLPQSVRDRLTVENDDKASMYSVKDLMYIHERTDIPIMFDYHHHQFNTGGLSEKDALELAISTWCHTIKPVVHYSESKALHEGNDKIKPQAHSDYIDKLPDTYGNSVDMMLECKAKELAILKLRKMFCS
jgi:UV DNA damage endonuclease